MVTRGNNVFALKQSIIPPTVATAITDLFLHALFARVALNNGENIEFETKYYPDTNTIELVVPDGAGLAFFDQITGLQRGTNFKTFIDWLIGSQTLAPSPVLFGQDFISASALSVWIGAMQGSLEGQRVILLLPSSNLAVVGYNARMDKDGDISIYLVWVYDSGLNTGFDIKTTVRATDILTGTSTDTTNTIHISTLNLLKGDVRETLLIQTPFSAAKDDIVSITISRNYEGSLDPADDLVGIVGLKIR